MELKLKVLHWIFFCEGKLEEAKLVLRLLRNGIVNLGLDDVSANVEVELETLGLKARYSRNYGIATYRLEGAE